jgi:peroxiredoxin Q/BCP
MYGILTLCASLGVAAGALAMLQAPPPPELKPGDAAPPFTLPGSDGRSHSLSEYAGKKPVVLAWFPKAFTGG